MRYFIVYKRKISSFLSIILSFFVISTLMLGFCYKTAMVSHTSSPIYEVTTTDRIVSVTVNLSPKTDIISMLEILKKASVTVTFFADRSYITDYPEKIKLISNSGQNISIMLNDMKEKSENEICNIIADDIEILSSITMKNTDFVRFFENSYTSSASKTIFSVDLFPIQWTTEDTEDNLANGSIILATSVEDLQIWIDRIKSEGFTAVPLDRLIYKSNYTIDLSGRQSKKIT